MGRIQASDWPNGTRQPPLIGHLGCLMDGLKVTNNFRVTVSGVNPGQCDKCRQLAPVLRSDWSVSLAAGLLLAETGRGL